VRGAEERLQAMAIGTQRRLGKGNRFRGIGM